MTHDGLECPKCGKHTIIQRSNDLFQCLNCEFKRDFSYIPEDPVPEPVVEIKLEPPAPAPQPDDAWDAVGAVIIFMILALFLGI